MNHRGCKRFVAKEKFKGRTTCEGWNETIVTMVNNVEVSMSLMILKKIYTKGMDKGIIYHFYFVIILWKEVEKQR